MVLVVDIGNCGDNGVNDNGVCGDSGGISCDSNGNGGGGGTGDDGDYHSYINYYHHHKHHHHQRSWRGSRSLTQDTQMVPQNGRGSRMGVQPPYLHHRSAARGTQQTYKAKHYIHYLFTGRL